MKTEFTIKRSKWLRGEGMVESYLMRQSDGKMCCLGQVALQCGVPPEIINREKVPSDMPNKECEKVGFLLLINGEDITENSLAQSAIRINDDKEMDDKTREKQLKSIFKQLGKKLNFID